MNDEKADEGEHADRKANEGLPLNISAKRFRRFFDDVQAFLPVRRRDEARHRLREFMPVFEHVKQDKWHGDDRDRNARDDADGRLHARSDVVRELSDPADDRFIDFIQIILLLDPNEPIGFHQILYEFFAGMDVIWDVIDQLVDLPDDHWPDPADQSAHDADKDDIEDQNRQGAGNPRPFNEVDGGIQKEIKENGDQKGKKQR